MTNREKATYDLIIKNSEQGLLTTKKEIVENYPYDRELRKDGYVWNDAPTSHDNCSAVWHDINSINYSDKDEVIIADNGFYWVGSKQETEDYVKEYFFKQCKPSLKRYWNLIKKLKINNSQDLFTGAVHRVCIEDE